MGGGGGLVDFVVVVVYLVGVWVVFFCQGRMTFQYMLTTENASLGRQVAKLCRATENTCDITEANRYL